MSAEGDGGVDNGDDVLVDWGRPGVAVVTLNRPDRLNALTSPMIDRLFGTFERLGRNPDCRVVVVTGAGRGFCAGDDLRDYRPPGLGLHRDRPDQLDHVPAETHRPAGAEVRAMPQPVMAAVNGAAAAPATSWPSGPTYGWRAKVPSSPTGS